jgi:hypothetical protein
VACFDSCSAVQAWLHNIDVMLGIVDMDNDEKRAMGNGNVLAACMGTETAKTCLESGRWEAQAIYYPKGEDPSLDGWTSTTMQAMGDATETKFWGDGDASW